MNEKIIILSTGSSSRADQHERAPGFSCKLKTRSSRSALSYTDVISQKSRWRRLALLKTFEVPRSWLRTLHPSLSGNPTCPGARSCLSRGELGPPGVTRGAMHSAAGTPRRVRGTWAAAKGESQTSVAHLPARLGSGRPQVSLT